MEEIKRLKFWIALGLLVLAGGAVLGVWFVPARKESVSCLSDWQTKRAKVGSYQDKKDKHGRPDVSAAQELQQEYARQLDQAKQILAQQDKLLEDYIPDLDGTRKPLDAGAWKEVHKAQMDALEDDVQTSFPSAPSSVVSQTDFGFTWPTPEEMREEAKRYWVQWYLLQAICEVNKVSVVIPALKSFKLVNRPDRLLTADDTTMFTPIAFEFAFSTEFESLPMVLHKLLQCKVGLSITTVRVKRRAKVSLGTQQKTGTTGRLLSATAVSSLLGPAATGRGGARGYPGARPGVAQGRMADMFAFRGPSAQDLRQERRVRDMPAGRRGRGSRAPRTTARQQQRTTQPARLSVEEAEAGLALVDVTVKGYVQDYISPAEAEAAEDAAGAAGQL